MDIYSRALSILIKKRKVYERRAARGVVGPVMRFVEEASRRL
jgi:hypothetical protein